LATGKFKPKSVHSFLKQRICEGKYTRSSADADKHARSVKSSVKVTKHGTIPYVRYGFLLVCYSNFVYTSLFTIMVAENKKSKRLNKLQQCEAKQLN